MTLKGKDRKEVKLMNGMACHAKIVIDEKKVLSYLLEKIDLLNGVFLNIFCNGGNQMNKKINHQDIFIWYYRIRMKY